MSLTSGGENKVEGWAIYIHPDFLNATGRGRKLFEYSFFGYDANECLHISDAEKNVLEDCLRNVGKEIGNNLDKHSHNLILTNLELLLSYCSRFYDRQFLTRVKAGNDLVEKFERLLNDHFAQDSLIETGVPDVKYFASHLNLSANYLSDLLSKYTGKSTQEHIHLKLIDKAKPYYGVQKGRSAKSLMNSASSTPLTSQRFLKTRSVSLRKNSET
ncbi:hypothetical protein SAMN05428947_11579 [Mucilaginibacter sp. OK283]|nr:hypothetical protein [Mucilaginibacter sp. OK283]SEP41469.1 hypothetical protein SAMN05428947_11579 [Mucilaginibacter sp. OK283]